MTTYTLPQPKAKFDMFDMLHVGVQPGMNMASRQVAIVAYLFVSLQLFSAPLFFTVRFAVIL